MNRKLVVVVAIAAVAAMLVGAAVGRSLLSPATNPTQRPDVVRFKDEISKVSIAYPGSWRRLPHPDDDPEVALLVAADATASALLQMRVARVGLATVTEKSLPIVRKFTDGLVAEDPRAKVIGEPAPVKLGGLPGLRYRYTYGSAEASGAHDHYFLFKGGRMIQLVFQATPAEQLDRFTPVFDDVAGTFRGLEK